MVAKSYFPETTLEDIAKISCWQPGYVVWGFRFWLWMMDKGVSITNYDQFDLEQWSKKGLRGLEMSVSREAFKYYIAHSLDLEKETEYLTQVRKHPNFLYKQVKPALEELSKSLNSNSAVEVILNSSANEKSASLTLHRVVVLDINQKQVIFHDPQIGPNTEVSMQEFENAWLKKNPEPELCVYSQ